MLHNVPVLKTFLIRKNVVKHFYDIIIKAKLSGFYLVDFMTYL